MILWKISKTKIRIVNGTCLSTTRLSFDLRDFFFSVFFVVVVPALFVRIGRHQPPPPRPLKNDGPSLIMHSEISQRGETNYAKVNFKIRKCFVVDKLSL